MPTIHKPIDPAIRTEWRFNEGLLRQMVNNHIDAQLEEIMDGIRDVIRAYTSVEIPKSEFMRVLEEAHRQ